MTKDNPGVVGPEPSQVKGSVSLLHVASGLYVNYAYLNQDNDSDVAHGPFAGDTTMHYVQGGIGKNWTGLGKTVLYGEYARIEDGTKSFGAPGLLPILSSNAEIYGLGVVQHIDAAAMEVFLSYRRYSADVDLLGIVGASADDMDVVMGGARIKF